MRNILFLGIVLALLWVGLNYVKKYAAVSESTNLEGGFDLGLPSESPFGTNFDEQFLCHDPSTYEWAMYGDPDDAFGQDCTGPYIDSRNLCQALERAGVDSIELWGEGRTLRCG